MPSEDAARLVARLLADPPSVHAVGGEMTEAPPLDHFGTDRECYELIAGTAGEGTRTLETGCGLSTVLFGVLGARHTCVVRFPQEVERLQAYCDQRGFDIASVTFAVGWSDEVLPGLARDELDLVLIDGGHGYPAPVLDWYYAGGRLARGGLLVVDDVALPAVAGLCRFLDRDPRWVRVAGNRKWIAYRRDSAGSLREEFVHQPFWPPPVGVRVRRLPGRARRALDRLRRRIRPVR